MMFVNPKITRTTTPSLLSKKLYFSRALWNAGELMILLFRPLHDSREELGMGEAVCGVRSCMCVGCRAVDDQLGATTRPAAGKGSRSRRAPEGLIGLVRFFLHALSGAILPMKI